MPKRILAIVVGIAVIASLIGVYIYKNSSINLNDYLIVTYEGYNGYGRATATIDWESIEEKYGSNIKFTKEYETQANALGVGGTRLNPMKMLESFITVNLEKSDSLSNDDEVSYNWVIDDNEIEKYINCKIKHSDGSVSVSGLEEVTTFDPFESIDVSFSGINSDGTAEIKNIPSEFENNSYYSCSPYTKLRNGDTVTVSFTPGDTEHFASIYGVIPSVTSKEYTVEGLGEYVSKISQIDDTTKSELKKKGDDIIATTSLSILNSVVVNSVTYVGDYLIDKKNIGFGMGNKYGLVYKFTVEWQAPEGYDNVVIDDYYYIYFEDLIAYPDGTCDVDIEDVKKERYFEDFTTRVIEGDSFNDKYCTLYGYPSIDALKTFLGKEVEWNLDDTAQ